MVGVEFQDDAFTEEGGVLRIVFVGKVGEKAVSQIGRDAKGAAFHPVMVFSIFFEEEGNTLEHLVDEERVGPCLTH